MTNILMIYTIMEPPVLLTERGTRSSVEKYGATLRLKQTGKVTVEDLLWCDVVLSVRTQSIYEAEILKIASKMGRFCTIEIDDDFFALEHHALRRPVQEKALKSALRTCDVIFSPNVTLAKKMCAIGNCDRYFVADTLVKEQEIFPRNPAPEGQLHIVYYVNDGSTGVFDALVRPILPQLIHRYGDRLTLTLMSLKPDLTEFEDQLKVNYRPRSSLDEFKAFLRQTPFSMGIAPLLDDTFSQGKYINKFIEFSSAGIPCIYSNVPPYKGFIEDGKTGILCENTPESWLDAIARLSDPKLQESIVLSAQNCLRGAFSEAALADLMRKQVPELITYKAPADVKPLPLWPARLKAQLWNVADPFLRAWGRFRLEGFGSVIRWTWQHYILRRR